MRAMAKLRPHVDAFFDKVTVNVATTPTRSCARTGSSCSTKSATATRAVADFSRIEG